jgi:membrane protein DedA with SNARE-associated domain
MFLHFFSHVHWEPLIASYGYWLIFAIVALESLGVPTPGEAMLVTAAVYAGHSHKLSIVLIVGVAAAGAVLGSLIGYWIGRTAGVPLLRRWGRYVGLDEKRIRLGQYVFDRHGGKIVFLGRFVSVLRAFVSLLAGANALGFKRFIAFTTAGSVVWAVGFGAAAFYFGRAIHRVAGPIGLTLLALIAVLVVWAWLFLKKHEAELQARADAAVRS